MSNDATTQSGTSPDPEGTEQTPSPEEQGTDYTALIASARKRQAGAEAARQAAEAKAKELEQKLAKYEKEHQSTEDKERTELATLQAKLAAAEERAAQAEAKAEARILDAKYPLARKELPEVTDEVRLAKFEAMLREPEEPESPTPIGVTGPRTGPNPSAKEESFEDVMNKFRKMPFPR